MSDPPSGSDFYRNAPTISLDGEPHRRPHVALNAVGSGYSNMALPTIGEPTQLAKVGDQYGGYTAPPATDSAQEPMVGSHAWGHSSDDADEDDEHYGPVHKYVGVHVKRSSHALCWVALVATITAVCTLLIAGYLSQDSRTLDRLQQRVSKYLDVMEAHQVPERIGMLADFVGEIIPVARNATRVFATAVAEGSVEMALIKAEQLPAHIHNATTAVDKLVSSVNALSDMFEHINLHGD